MGKLLTILGFVMWSGISVLHAQEAPQNQQLADKDKVSKDLILLRDSVNSTIARLSQQEVQASDPMRPAYPKMTQDLNRFKIQLDKAVEDVVNSDWNTDVRIRTSQTVADVRREYKRILSELRQEPRPEK
jgi:hypothetical protein